MIEMTGLTKTYGGTTAVRGLTLKVEKGDIYGFIGPNGAGKTTTIRMLATLLTPSSGEARVCGFRVDGQAKEVRRVIGYMPDSFGVYEEMRVDEYLEFFAAAYGIKRGARPKVVQDILELVDLWHKREDVIGNLSRGTQQRLGLARVLVHDPQVLLLDEPASGLDPRARVEIRELIRELGRMGKTILISSHILPELGDLCNKVGIIEKGQLVYTGPVSEVARQVQAGRVVMVRVAERMEEAQALLARRPEVAGVNLEGGALRVALVEAGAGGANAGGVGGAGGAGAVGSARIPSPRPSPAAAGEGDGGGAGARG
ncbi:MAG: ABC transporter ATP-binding protein, partial [Planctomycetes bacterium]|nr:ABC transporter ATP-binding protein [Planctomycetota bacterium]